MNFGSLRSVSLRRGEQYGHHTEGGGQECEDELVCERRYLAPVARVGQQADVEAESTVPEGAANAVQATRQAAQHRHQ
jgi:hypothetical protein